MNKWECDEPYCECVAFGQGGAIGLRAIGWYYAIGGPLVCPRHRPDPIPCVQDGDEGAGEPKGDADVLCGQCAGARSANEIQATLTTAEDGARRAELLAENRKYVETLLGEGVRKRVGRNRPSKGPK